MPDRSIQTVDDQACFARLQQELQEDAETDEPLPRTSIGTGTLQRTSEATDEDMQAVEKKSGGVGGVPTDCFNTLMLRRSFGGGDRSVEEEKNLNHDSFRKSPPQEQLEYYEIR